MKKMMLLGCALAVSALLMSMTVADDKKGKEKEKERTECCCKDCDCRECTCHTDCAECRDCCDAHPDDGYCCGRHHHPARHRHGGCCR